MEGATIGVLSLSEIESTFLNKENNMCKNYNDRIRKTTCAKTTMTGIK